VEDNLALVDRIADYHLDRPVLIGASRKRFVGAASGITDPARRVDASVQVAVRAASAGAAIVRVHDVGTTIEGLRRAGLRA
jgi:dihydropteroate synthase